MAEHQTPDEQRGEMRAHITHISADMADLRKEMKEQHEALAKTMSSFDERLKPLEKLRYIAFGIGIACIAVLPVIIIYVRQLNALLERVNTFLPPGSVK